MHKFEIAGLGKAPFRFVSLEEKVFQATPFSKPKAGSSCDYCATAIRFVYWCESADGRRFKVGCDCVEKVAGGERDPLLRAVKRAKTDHAKAKVLARIDAAKARLTADPDFLADQPHPKSPRGTLRSYAEWLLKNAGAAGKARACKLIEQA